MLKESEEEKEEEEEDMIDTFESSLESLFNHFSPSQGNPLALHTYTPPASSLHPESITIRIPPQSHNELFSHYQWQSGIRLANEIAMERIEVKLLHILELGAGTGLPGIMAAKMGAQSVVLSDYDDVGLVDNMKRNIETIFPTSNSSIKAWGHIWGNEIDPSTLPFFSSTPSTTTNIYDMILLADTLWSSGSHLLLLASLTSLLSHSSAAVIQLVAGLHTGRESVNAFLLKASNVGLVVEGEMWEVRCDAEGEEGERERRKWGWDEGKPSLNTIEDRARWVVEGRLKWSEEKLRSF